MLSLEQIEANFITTLNNGPDTLDTSLFSGSMDRVLLGLKAHANTISHARLVALEDSFPLTRAELGDEDFNRLSRIFATTDAAKRCDNNAMGRHFAAFLKQSDVDQTAVDLAAIEWAWLHSYHAAEAATLRLSDIAGLSGAQLIATTVQPHPSSQLIRLSAPLSKHLAEVAVMMAAPVAILSVRPEVDVMLVPLDDIATALFAAAEKTSTIGNLLALAAEHPNITDPVGPLMTLIGAGALMEAR